MKFESLRSTLNDKTASCLLIGALGLSVVNTMVDEVQVFSADQSTRLYSSEHSEDVIGVTQHKQKVTDLGEAFTHSLESSALLLAANGLLVAYQTKRELDPGLSQAPVTTA